MLSPEEVENIAKLARLSLTEEERNKFAGQMSSILEYVSSLSQVDTEDVEPMHHVADVTNVFGKDEVIGSDESTKDSIISQFPEKSGEHLKVKAVFK